MANRIVKHTLEIIHLLTDQNPVQVSGCGWIRLSPIFKKKKYMSLPLKRQPQARNWGRSVGTGMDGRVGGLSG